ncbi:hypothetical protein T4D_14085 [Trichinella pseudospiralis]|uniref:Uncharacterized protein n=1 Tax=Trichinella pseudospiralis TaxID=6337 RepID=A0A0V1FVA1_TRIPS|nr:hypothetical protein T4D_14085 [Trichinella pseudospiralis]
MENLLHMSFLPINLATVKASATDIAHQARPCGVGGGKGWKGNFKADFANVVRKKLEYTTAFLIREWDQTGPSRFPRMTGR